MNAKNKVLAVRNYLRWLAMTHPQVLAETLKRVPPPVAQLNGLFDSVLGIDFNQIDSWLGKTASTASTSSTPATVQVDSWLDKIGPIITGVGQAVVQIKGQSDLMKINLERARQGLDPITAQEAGTAVGVSVGVDSGTAAAVGAGLSIPLLMVLGIGAFVLMRK